MIDNGNHVVVIIGHPPTDELVRELIAKSITGSEIHVISDPTEINDFIADRNVPINQTAEDLVELLKDFKPYEETKEDFEPKRNKKGKKLKNWQTTNGWR